MSTPAKAQDVGNKQAQHELVHAAQLNIYGKLHQRHRGAAHDRWATGALVLLLAVATCHWTGISSRAFTSADTGIRVREHMGGLYGPFSMSQLFGTLFEMGNDLLSLFEEQISASQQIPMEDARQFMTTLVGQSKDFARGAFGLYTKSLIVALPVIVLVSMPLSLVLPHVLAATPAATFVLCLASLLLSLTCVGLGITALVLWLNNVTLYAALCVFAMVRLWITAGQLRGRKMEVQAIRFAGRLLSRQGWLVAFSFVALFAAHVSDLLTFLRLGSVVTGEGAGVTNAEHFSIECQTSLTRFGREGTQHCCTWSWDSLTRRPVCLVPLAAAVGQRWLLELLMPHLVLYLVAHVTSREFLTTTLRASMPPAAQRERRVGTATMDAIFAGSAWEDVLVRPIRHFLTSSLGTAVAASAISALLWHGPDVLRIMYPGSNLLIAVKGLASILYVAPMWITMRAAVAGDNFQTAMKAATTQGLWGMFSGLLIAIESTVLLLSIIGVTASTIMTVGGVALVALLMYFDLGNINLNIEGSSTAVAEKVVVGLLLLTTCSTCMGTFLACAIWCLVVMFLTHRECAALVSHTKQD